MPSVSLHPCPSASSSRIPEYPPENPFPPLLQTPSGLALLELQGTIQHEMPDEPADEPDGPVFETPVGKLLFPDYSPQTPADDTRWMKRAYLYVGRYQRMAGEVKRLGRPIAVIRRVDASTATSTATAATGTATGRGDNEAVDALEIVDIVRFKVVFASRPEPVNDG
ncbi:hypothetical protein PHISP_00978 [Aspergillus sp. HF37]|nr:hypothetical protein PHISP_00978 [Aspergillus sp. HF37]